MVQQSLAGDFRAHVVAAPQRQKVRTLLGQVGDQRIQPPLELLPGLHNRCVSGPGHVGGLVRRPAAEEVTVL